MNTKLYFVVLLSLVAICSACYSGTALDDYIAYDDGAYRYSYVGNTTYSYGVAVNLKVTSLIYQNTSFSDQVLWVHDFYICVPNTPLYKDIAYFAIAGSNNGASAYDGRTPFLSTCSAGIISAILYQAPNQPMDFPDEKASTEDQIVAHTFRTYMNESGANPSQIILLAMAKAAIKGFDTVQEYLRYDYPVSYKIKKFIVSGASKRGWTTWLAGAADERVAAIIPIVIPLLNMENNLVNTWGGLGEWGFAFDPYTNQRIFDFKGLPQFDKLMGQVDPLSYNSRFEKLPKLVIDSSNDQFFLLDGPRHFWNALKGPKWLTILPNTEHSMAYAIAYNQIAPIVVGFFKAVAEGVALPSWSWDLHYSNKTSDKPSVSFDVASGNVSSVALWSCTTHPGKRDFRYQTCEDPVACNNGLSYTPSSVTLGSNGHAVATLATPNAITANIADQSWTGFFVQAKFTVGPFKDGTTSTLSLSTEANIFPDFYPYAQFVPNYAAIGQAPTPAPTKAPTPTPTKAPTPAPCSATTTLSVVNTWVSGVQWIQYNVVLTNTGTKDILDYKFTLTPNAGASISSFWNIEKVSGNNWKALLYGTLPAKSTRNDVQGFIVQGGGATVSTLSVTCVV